MEITEEEMEELKDLRQKLQGAIALMTIKSPKTTNYILRRFWTALNNFKKSGNVFIDMGQIPESTEDSLYLARFLGRVLKSKPKKRTQLLDEELRSIGNETKGLKGVESWETRVKIMDKRRILGNLKKEILP